MSFDEEKMKFEEFKHYRDEQFWFTTAVVAFNVYLIGKNDDLLLVCSLAICSSVFGAHLVMTRWLSIAGIHPDKSPDLKKDKVIDRLRFTCEEIYAWIRMLPWVVCELSGILLYLLAITLTGAEAVRRHWPC